MIEFPKWKYHSTKGAVVVEDEEAEQALGKGWFDSKPGVPESAEDDDDRAAAEMYRKELLAKARALGIDIYHTSGVEKIQAAIDAHEDNE